MDAAETRLARPALVNATGVVGVVSLALVVMCGPSGCKDESPGACQDRQCGTWDGQDCGICADREYCDDQGQCREACFQRQCGVSYGVSCGECSDVEQCDQGQCIPVCSNRCGPVQGLDCGECSSSREICSVDGYCIPCVPPPCPEEFGPAGEICINGWVNWLMDDGEGVFLENTMLDRATEDATEAVVKVYDPLLYALDPVNTPPLGIGEVNPVCGTFRVLNVSIPGTGVLALMHDDLDNDVADLFVQVGVPYQGTASQHLTEIVAFAVTTDQMLQWTEAVGGATMLESIGCPEPAGGGERTMSNCGTGVHIFFGMDGIKEGFRLYEPGDPLTAEKALYPGINAAGELVFDDPTEGVIWSDDQGPHEWTGILGTVFYLNAGQGNMVSECVQGSPCPDPGCIWEARGVSIPGTFFVHWMIPVVDCGL